MERMLASLPDVGATDLDRIYKQWADKADVELVGMTDFELQAPSSHEGCKLVVRKVFRQRRRRGED